MLASADGGRGRVYGVVVVQMLAVRSVHADDSNATAVNPTTATVLSLSVTGTEWNPPAQGNLHADHHPCNYHVGTTVFATGLVMDLATAGRGARAYNRDHHVDTMLSLIPMTGAPGFSGIVGRF